MSTAQERFDLVEEEILSFERMIRYAERNLTKLRAEAQKLYAEMLAERAAKDSNAYAPGTRVHHHLWSDIKATVVESDGSGVVVIQDGNTVGKGGFRADEWVVEA